MRKMIPNGIMLRAARSALGISQKVLGEEIFVTRSTIARMEETDDSPCSNIEAILVFFKSKGISIYVREDGKQVLIIDDSFYNL